jgi:hypothetical protein
MVAVLRLNFRYYGSVTALGGLAKQIMEPQYCIRLSVPVLKIQVEIFSMFLI